ncbi:uncharacterized protein LOC128166357 [Crassostrea angulata]|uniref:uncharacterized protein LOC128166357 n=1 Tax=Magallana angulata TaxID=2784310 RepID=UPI0022B21C7F|nr:uncharacterized protein LOC128166357 [Crassostrea angulata]
MNRLIIVFCIYFFTNIRLVNSQSINFTNLLLHHLTMCGPENVCNITQFSYRTPEFKISKSHKLCPNCFCDNSCFGRGDCCPDKYFAHSDLVCNNVTFVNATQDESREQRSSFLLIKKCPDGTEQPIKEKCEKEANSIDKLKYPPVTSMLTNLTYANRICAQCNHEPSYQFWNLDIYCRVFLDINFLSSFKEVVDHGIEHACVMQFAPHDDKAAYNCYHLQGFHFDSCNKTGFWKKKDNDLLYACESMYVNNDTLFKNPFCRMCNPTFFEGDIITQCNVTGMWNDFDRNIKQACSRFGFNEGTFPFKNIFCRICNAPDNFKYNYVDASAKISTKVFLTFNKKDLYHMSIIINNFSKEYFKLVTNKIPKSEHRMKQKTPGIILNNNQTLNVTELIYKSFSFKKYVKVCNSHGIPKNLSNLFISCTCNPSCFHHNDCCEDFALQYPAECIHSKQLAGEHFKRTKPDVEYTVTNGCYMQFQYPMYMEKLCQDGAEGSDIFSSYPIRDITTGISYLNMYCYLCNTSPQRPVFDLGKPWNIELYCKKYIDHRNFITIKQLVVTLKDTNCNITYLPISSPKGKGHQSVPLCHREQVRYNKCNLTGKWLIKDPQIIYACENVSSRAFRMIYAMHRPCKLHKNQFCALCNPEMIENITISKCNASGKLSFYDHRDEIGCQFFPQIAFYSPYKNIFCKHCNNRTDRVDCSGGLSDGYYSITSKRFKWTPIFRNLFLYSELRDDFLENESHKCKSTESYMRNLTVGT